MDNMVDFHFGLDNDKKKTKISTGVLMEKLKVLITQAKEWTGLCDPCMKKVIIVGIVSAIVSAWIF